MAEAVNLKIRIHGADIFASSQLLNINEDEMALLKEFYRFEEKIVEASNRFSPSVIAEYILGVARKYNEFYAKNRIIDQKEEVFRIF